MNLSSLVPPVPDEFRTPKIAAVRRRARRRRQVAVAAAAGGATLALLVAVVVALPGRREAVVPPVDATARPSETVVIPAPPQPIVPTGVRPVAWQFARLDRDDQTITVFANPAEGCVELVGAVATFEVQPDKVVVTMHGTNRAADDCTRSGLAAPARIVVPERLNGRPLVDAVTARQIQPFPDRILPEVPADWHEVPTGYFRMTGDEFTIPYTRVGGPDISFRMWLPTGPAPSGSDTERIRVGWRTAFLVEVNGAWTVRWRADGFDALLTLLPGEGQALTRAEAMTYLGRLGW